MASTYLTRTTGTPTNGKKYTWSVWTKINPNSSAHNYLFSEYRTGNDRDEFAILSASNDNFRWESLNSGNNVAYFKPIEFLEIATLGIILFLLTTVL
jgi:hypothetical protein